MPQSDWINSAQLIPEYSTYKVDGSGRIIIPAHLRKKFGIEFADDMEYYTAFIDNSWFMCVRLDTKKKKKEAEAKENE